MPSESLDGKYVVTESRKTKNEEGHIRTTRGKEAHREFTYVEWLEGILEKQTDIHLVFELLNLIRSRARL